MIEVLNKDIISIKDLTKEEILYILEEAKIMDEQLKNKDVPQILSGKVIGLLFFESSTRTRLSFDTAAKRLGASVTGFASSTGTSVDKGETLSDTVKTVEQYADLVAIRHPYEGAARLVSDSINLPVINCGDGANQHPTQTLLDLYTIWKHKQSFELNVSLVGDLKHSRTTRSLVYALAMFGASIRLITPKGLEMDEEVVHEVEKKWNVSISATSDFESGVKDSDVIYVVRIQKERFADPLEYEKLKKSYKVDKKALSLIKENAVIMHPLPRVDEITMDVDSTHHAIYFDQAYNGIPIRMALLKELINRGD